MKTLWYWFFMVMSGTVVGANMAGALWYSLEKAGFAEQLCFYVFGECPMSFDEFTHWVRWSLLIDTILLATIGQSTILVVRCCIFLMQLPFASVFQRRVNVGCRRDVGDPRRVVKVLESDAMLGHILTGIEYSSAASILLKHGAAFFMFCFGVVNVYENKVGRGMMFFGLSLGVDVFLYLTVTPALMIPDEPPPCWICLVRG